MAAPRYLQAPYLFQNVYPRVLLCPGRTAQMLVVPQGIHFSVLGRRVLVPKLHNPNRDNSEMHLERVASGQPVGD